MNAMDSGGRTIPLSSDVEELLPASGFVAWTWTLAVAFLDQRLLVPDQQPWRMVRLQDGNLPSDAYVPSGPVVYASTDVAQRRWRYVGQSRDLVTRLPKHTSSGDATASTKASAWEQLVVVRLVHDVTDLDLDRCEETIGTILRPDRSGGGAGRYPRTGIRRAS